MQCLFKHPVSGLFPHQLLPLCDDSVTSLRVGAELRRDVCQEWIWEAQLAPKASPAWAQVLRERREARHVEWPVIWNGNKFQQSKESYLLHYNYESKVKLLFEISKLKT